MACMTMQFKEQAEYSAVTILKEKNKFYFL